MSLLWFVLWTVICVPGAGGLVYFIMQSRLEVLLAQQREELAALRATLEERRWAMDGRIKNSEETTRRKALDEFLSEIRVEERSYVREQKHLFKRKKILVRQERIFFRNIPLSSWVEQEMTIEEGTDIQKLGENMAVFMDALPPAAEDAKTPVRRLLR